MDLPKLPPASILLVTSTLVGTGDLDRANRLLTQYMLTPVASAVTLLATYDLASRVAAYSGHVLAVGAKTEDGESRPLDEAPLSVQVAARVANHIASSEASEALSYYLEVAREHSTDRAWAGEAQVFALGTLRAVMNLEPQEDGQHRVLSI
jgi:hypothetical protein